MSGCVENDGDAEDHFRRRRHIQARPSPRRTSRRGVSELPKKIFVLDSEGEAYVEFDVWNPDRSKRYPTFTLRVCWLSPGRRWTIGTRCTGRRTLPGSFRCIGSPGVRLSVVQLQQLPDRCRSRIRSTFSCSEDDGQGELLEGSCPVAETTYYTGPVGSFHQSGSVGIRGVKMEYESQV